MKGSLLPFDLQARSLIQFHLIINSRILKAHTGKTSESMTTLPVEMSLGFVESYNKLIRHLLYNSGLNISKPKPKNRIQTHIKSNKLRSDLKLGKRNVRESLHTQKSKRFKGVLLYTHYIYKASSILKISIHVLSPNLLSQTPTLLNLEDDTRICLSKASQTYVDAQILNANEYFIPLY